MDAIPAAPILGLEIRDVRIPLLRTYRTAGTIIDSRRLIIVRVAAGDGTGWGEAAPVPGYSPETAEDVWTELTQLADSLIGAPAAAAGAALSRITAPSARHALETALLDAQGRDRGRPVSTALGGGPGPVPIGAVTGTDASAEDLIALQDAGYARIKVKVDGLDSFERAVERIAWSEVSIPVAVDANGSLDPADADQIATIADLIPLQFLEQPFPADRLEDSVRLAAATSTPVCLDESIISPDAATEAASIGAASVVAVKPSRLGGLRAGVDTAVAAAAAGASAWVGGMLESGIGRAASLALARAIPGGLAADLTPPDGYLAADLIGSPWTVLSGSIVVADSPGLGIDVDLDEVDRFTDATAAAGRL